jgi:hypothetical protein
VRALPAGVTIAIVGLALLVPAGGAGAHGSATAKRSAALNRAPASGALGVRALSERRLRAFERRILGPEHAAEHARARRSLNRKGGRARLRRAQARARKRFRAVRRRKRVRTAAAGQDGFWSAPFQIPVMGIHSAVLPTGKVMFFSYKERRLDPSNNEGWAYLWDPATDDFTEVRPPLWRDPADGRLKPANIWCAGQSFLADGRLLVTGGNMAYETATEDYKGLNKVYTFNPWSETWTEQPDMRHGRWYPSQVLMADGRAVIMSGLDESGVINPPPETRSYNKDIEIFTPSEDLDGRGQVTVLGEREGEGQAPRGGYYPHMFWMPSGRMLVAGQEQRDSWYLNNPGQSNAYSWTDAPDLLRHRTWGTAVMMPRTSGAGVSGKIWEIGGGYSDQPNSSTEIFDEQDPGWVFGPALNTARSHHNTVILPSGTDFYPDAEGNPRGDNHRKVELWDAESGLWRYGAKQEEPRAYHSTAMLLPDGRVISAGDDKNGGLDQDTAEIYTPPYLLTSMWPRPATTCCSC